MPQIVRRGSVKKVWNCIRGNRPFFSGCVRRVDSEHHLNKLQIRAQAAAVSADNREDHETLRLLL